MVDSPGGRIQFDVTDAENFRNSVSACFFAVACAPQYSTNPRHQFARIEWLWQVVISTDFQTNDAVNFFATSSKQQNWNPRAGTKAAENFEAVHSGQHHVQYDQHVVSLTGSLQAANAIVNCLDAKPLRFQVLGD